MKIQTVKLVYVSEWDKLVKETYKRPYSFQQQDGCKDRGCFSFSVPDKADDYENDTVPEEVNHEKMGVSFNAWLNRDPNKPLKEDEAEWANAMWWERNFYPNVQMIANDLYKRGLLDKCEYTIDID